MRIPALSLLALSSLTAFAQTPVTIELVPWATGLSGPVDIAHAGDDRLFVVEQPGVIKIISDSMTVLPTPFLNITAQVNDNGNEQGLLGLAFDPDYANTGRFYVYYTASGGGPSGQSRVSRFQVTADPNVADPNSEEILYTWPQPFSNHNGGDLEFGPDGYLYVGFGDGGSGGDPNNHAQSLDDPLGDMIRIDVSGASGYTVPPDNPWVGAQDTLPEIWASGLRNPFRFGFDALTGDLWIGDVGQNAWEEFDFWPAGDNSGPNFGWRCREGLVSYNMSGCTGGYVDPVAVYENVWTGGTWCSAIGGRVYRGSQYPRFDGRYICTDYCSGHFMSILPDGQGGWDDELLLDSGNGWVCIAENVNGELFTCNESSGQVRKITDPCPMDAPMITLNGTDLESTPASSYTWYLDGQAIPNSNTQVFTPQELGDYYVVADLGNGCQLQSNVINVTGTVGVDEQDSVQATLVPNPADDVFILTIDRALTGEVRVMDLAGRVALTVPLAVDRARIPTAGLNAGTYLVEVVDRNGEVLLIERVLVRH